MHADYVYELCTELERLHVVVFAGDLRVVHKILEASTGIEPV